MRELVRWCRVLELLVFTVHGPSGGKELFSPLLNSLPASLSWIFRTWKWVKNRAHIGFKPPNRTSPCMSLGLLSSLTFPDGIAFHLTLFSQKLKVAENIHLWRPPQEALQRAWTEPSTLLMGVPWSSCRADYFLLLYLSLMDPGLTGD